MTQDKDVRFCPYCSYMEFDLAKVDVNVHCEVCGIDVPVDDLVRAV